jgi:hypothetical protein
MELKQKLAAIHNDTPNFLAKVKNNSLRECSEISSNIGKIQKLLFRIIIILRHAK